MNIVSFELLIFNAIGLIDFFFKGLLTHFEQMKFDPKHQKDTQHIVLQTLKQQHQQNNLQQQQQNQKIKEENYEDEIALNLNDILMTSLITNGIELETPVTTATTVAASTSTSTNQIVSANMIAQNMLDNLSQPTNGQTGNGATTPNQQQRFQNGTTPKAVKSSASSLKATTATSSSNTVNNNSNVNNNSTYWT